MEISNLVDDLVEEILCKLPVTSLREIRLTCKKWNSLSKTQSFAEKYINKAESAATREKELSMIMVLGYKVLLTGLHNINGVPSITRKAELVGLKKVNINRVYHCDGLLLCSTEQELARGLVVWNPYWSQTKWISTPKHSYRINDYYALGYEVINNSRSHSKILKFFKRCNKYRKIRSDGYEIYDFKYKSWRDVVITPQEWNMNLCQHPGGVTLKGNTYWFGKESNENFLICFDFTRERFGPRMSFPIAEADNVVLSSVKGEKLAVLVERWTKLKMEIWITSEIKPTMVSWNKLFLTVRMTPHGDSPLSASNKDGSFFIDEENKVVVFVGRNLFKPRHTAYIYGVRGYLGKVDIGESKDCFCSRMVCSYAPSFVHIG